MNEHPLLRIAKAPDYLIAAAILAAFILWRLS